MKKIKFLLPALAIIFAVAGAFATTSVEVLDFPVYENTPCQSAEVTECTSFDTEADCSVATQLKDAPCGSLVPAYIRIGD